MPLFSRLFFIFPALFAVCVHAAEPQDSMTLAGRSAGMPSWLVVEGRGGDFNRTRDLIINTTRIINRSATGRALARTLTVGGGRVVIRKGATLMVSDSENAVYVGPRFVEGKSPEAMAALFAHELEHLVQRQSGVTLGREARELTAFLVQGRVWVEIGAPVLESDWEANRSNTQDMWAWLNYPNAAMLALHVRGRGTFDISNRKVLAYWKRVLRDEASWRRQNASRFPRGRDSRAAAMFILNQALRAAHGRAPGHVSNWIPDFIERAAQEGRIPPLPNGATTKDQILLNAFRPLAESR